MLISKVTDETESAQGEAPEPAARRARSYQSASQLFDVMTKNQRFEGNVDESLTTQDLVLLYKNLDLGTHLMSDANDVKRPKPNQRVETVIYDEPESDSDTSENYSKDEIQHIYNINQERINLLDNGSFDNFLCHKLGGLQIQSSEIITDSGTQFLLTRDPFIKEQLRSLNAMASGYEIQSLLPTSLLDYVCCKRIKDNYNFYMDNIIKYVQQTIDQLKRISNGDYLTDCAKEKWEKANKMNLPQNSSKVLDTSTSLRPAVKCNETVTWHDVVRSEIDVRSLSKVLEKKIVLEIPKLICGSYKLFSKRYAESFIITFKKEKQTQGVEHESRLDVVLKLRRLQTGQVTSTIDSVTILKASPAGHDLCIRENLPIAPQPSNNTVIAGDLKHEEVSTKECKKDEEIAESDPDTRAVIEDIVTEIFGSHGLTGMLSDNVSTEMLQDNDSTETFRDDVSTEVSRHVLYHTESNLTSNETSDVTCEQEIISSLEFQQSSQCSCESSTPFDFRDALVATTFQVNNEATYNLVSPDELRATMLRLSMQKAVPEESSEEASSPVTVKKKSPVRVRIKSPYENKSHILEEKKRNKLLEIRERRVKKKIALGENAKVCKHRYGKSGVVPQASVTKLSISNKSFYNSIYGHNMDDGKQRSQPRPKNPGRYSPSNDVPMEQVHDNKHKSPTRMPDRNNKKYTNRSYYLDDTETEIMYMSKIQEDAKETRENNTSSPSTSTVSTDFKKNLTFLSELTGVDLRTDNSAGENQSLYHNKVNKNAGCCNKKSLEDIENLPGVLICSDTENDDSKEAPVSLECRKSIEKLYNLIRKLENSSKTELNTSIKLQNASNAERSDVKTVSTLPASDSGTSLKHYVTSSNPSSFSFDKTNVETQKFKGKKEHTPTVPTVPKVVISSKFEKLELKRGRKRLSPKRSVTKVAMDNPLKGISQLLQEVDHVQKIRQTKFGAEPKPVRKLEVPSNDGRPVVIRHSLVKRRSRFDQYNMKDNDTEKKNITSKDKRTKPLTPAEISRIPLQQIPVDDKSKKKMADIIDEAKEARGEAVRGPSKMNSRIMTLAQPKRSYVQAHSEEYQTKYGRNLMADRLQRLAGTLPSPPATTTESILRNISSPKTRPRREALSNVSAKPVQVQPIDSSRETRRSASKSPQPISGSRNTTSLKASDPPVNVKKMVAVESYVRSHYGRFQHTEPAQLRDQITPKPRILLLPNNIDISNSSADELGKELHHIIDSIVGSPIPNQGSKLAEDETANLKVNPTLILGKTNSIAEEDLDSRRTDSDFKIGVLDDKSLKTAVQSQDNGDKRDDPFDNDTFDNTLVHLQTSHSTSELDQLENALYSHLSGVFQKRLRLKSLTLTPKASLNHVFLLQAGDTKSLIVKSDLKAVSKLSPHLNFDCAQIPVQIATVGYTYPLLETNTRPHPELTPMRRLETSLPDLSAPDMHCYKSDKTNQCFKGVHQETDKDQPAQVDVQDILMKTFGSKPTFTVSEFMSGAMDSDDLEDNIQVDKCTITEKLSVPKQSISTTMSVASTEDKALAQDDVEYTRSLDILVGLLNEIQKITRPNPPEDLECRNLESMWRGAAAEADTRREISIDPSLDKFDPNTGIYSYYISNSLSNSPKASFLVDKEVSVDLVVQKELKNTFTEVPSILPVVLNHGISTSVSNSLVAVFPSPSSQSLVSLDDYRSMCSIASCGEPHPSNIITELPVVDPVEMVKKVDRNAKSYEKALRQPKHKGNARTVMSVVLTKRQLITKADFDPSIKIKRDILVTVYSILVFTVFAALSFPDMVLFGA